MPRRSFALILCYAAMIAIAVAVNLIPIILTAVSAQFGGLSAEERGRIGGLTFAGAMISFICLGPLVDRLPAYAVKAAAVCGNFGIALGMFLLATAPSYSVVLAASLLMGLGAGSLDLILSPIIAVLQPRHRTVAMNLLHGFYCVGAVLTILSAGPALALGAHWWTITLCLLPYPLLLGVAFLFARVPPLVAEGMARTPLRRMIQDPFFLLILLAMILSGASELGFAYWLPTYAHNKLHFPGLSADMASLLAFLGFNLAMAAGRLTIGSLGHRIRAVDLLMACCAGCTAFCLIAAFAPPIFALAASILVGLASSTFWPSSLAMASDRHPHGGGSMFAILGALGNAGGVAMPWLMGFIGDRTSLSMGVVAVAACPVVMFLTLLFLRKIPQQAIHRVEPAGFPVS